VAQAETAEELMRSRYAAYAVGESDYVFRTWHPRTRPDDLAPDPSLTWTGLTIVDSGEDWVEFSASYEQGGRTGELRERSRFEQRGGRWVYVDGDVG
jgi:SEC-C motif-containing protein